MGFLPGHQGVHRGRARRDRQHRRRHARRPDTGRARAGRPRTCSSTGSACRRPTRLRDVIAFTRAGAGPDLPAIWHPREAGGQVDARSLRAPHSAVRRPDRRRRRCMYLCRGRHGRGVRRARSRHRRLHPGPGHAVAPPLLVAATGSAGRSSRRGRGRIVSGWLAGSRRGPARDWLPLRVGAVDRIRDILVRVTPALLDFIAFGLDPASGAVLNVAFGAVCGLIGAGCACAPRAASGGRSSRGVGVVVL